MIKRVTRGWPYDHEQLGGFHSQIFQHRWKGGVRLKACEVHILLYAIVTFHLRTACSKSSQSSRGKSLWHDDARCKAERDMVRGLMLVIHQRHTADSEHSACQHM